MVLAPSNAEINEPRIIIGCFHDLISIGCLEQVDHERCIYLSVEYGGPMCCSINTIYT
jgi:hypothetical protein